MEQVICEHRGYDVKSNPQTILCDYVLMRHSSLFGTKLYLLEDSDAITNPTCPKRQIIVMYGNRNDLQLYEARSSDVYTPKPCQAETRMDISMSLYLYSN